MASNPEYVQYIVDQLSNAGEITCRRMFGEYGVYCGGKIFALICENQLFIKITEAGRKVCPGMEEQPPYEEAKPYFLVEAVDNKDLLAELAIATCRELPPPGKRAKRVKK